MRRAVLAVVSLLLSTGACFRVPGPRSAGSLDADGRALCRTAFVALVQERLQKGTLTEPIYLEAPGTCSEVLDEMEVALVDGHRLAEQRRHAPVACPGRGCDRTVDGGTLLAVHGPRFLTGAYDCYNRQDLHLAPDPRPPAFVKPELHCSLAPTDDACFPDPPYAGDLAVALDVDTSCGPLSEGRCANFFDGAHETYRLHCKGGRWRILPGLYLMY
jgi:hypothetical protein